jgi:hypothetical protein
MKDLTDPDLLKRKKTEWTQSVLPFDAHMPRNNKVSVEKTLFEVFPFS